MPSRNPPTSYGEPLAGTVGPTDAREASKNRQLSDGVAETGTTVVALTAGDAVVLGADRRASLGGRFVANKRVMKVERVHPTAAMALSGTVGHIQSFTRTMRAEADLYEVRRGERMSMEALSTLSGNVLRRAVLHVTPVLAGVDDDGPVAFSLDGGGGVMADEYVAAGSGMQLAYGVLERAYDPGATAEEARAVAARAIASASERDTASGNGLALATVTGDGVDLAEFDDPAAVGEEAAA